MTWTIRPATDADGPEIGKLFIEADYPDHGADWHQAGLGQWWLVAEREDGKIVGAIQIAVSRPWGWILELLVHPDMRGQATHSLSKRTLGDLGEELWAAALVVMERLGIDTLLFVVKDDNRGLQHVMAQRTTTLGQFTMFARRIR